MPIIPFLVSADGQPTRLHSAIKGQPTKGIPPIASGDPTWRDYRDYGGGASLDQNRYDALAFSPGGEPLTQLVGKLMMEPGDKSLGDLDPNDYGLLHMLGNLFGGRYAVTNPSGTIRQWRFDTGQTVDPNIVQLAMMHFTNVLPGEIVHDALVGGMSIAAEPDNNLQIKFNTGAGWYLQADDGVVETGVGSPTIPLVRGIWPQQMTDTDDGDLWVKLVADNANGTWNIQVALGSSTVEPTWSGTQTITLGKWLRVLDSVTGLYVGGSLGAAIEVYFPVGATFEANAVFRIPANRPNWADSLGTSRAISSVDSLFVLDGDEIRVTGGWEVASAYETFEVTPDTGRLQNHLVDRRGQLITTVSPTRRIEDLTIQSALLRRQTVSLVIRAETETLIPGETEPFQAIILCPSVSIGGGVYRPGEGSDTAEESPTLRCGVPSSTFSYTDDRGNTFTSDQAVSIYLRNNIATL